MLLKFIIKLGWEISGTLGHGLCRRTGRSGTVIMKSIKRSLNGEQENFSLKLEKRVNLKMFILRPLL